MIALTLPKFIWRDENTCSTAVISSFESPYRPYDDHTTYRLKMGYLTEDFKDIQDF